MYVAKSQMGTKLLEGFVENQAEYQAASQTDKATLKNEAFEKWMAYLLIRGSDQAKYGSLIKGFVSQFSLGNDQYPKTITTATDVLSNHKIDPRYYENAKRSRDKARAERVPDSGDPTIRRSNTTETVR